MTDKINIFWFRRDLRLNDNNGLFNALLSGKKVQPIFIFDKEILDKLPKDDARVSFIHQEIENINQQLENIESTIDVYYVNRLTSLNPYLKKMKLILFLPIMITNLIL